MRPWFSGVLVIVGVALGGLLFAPVFGLAAIAGPVLVAALAVVVVDAVVLRLPPLALVRPPLIVLVGAAALAAVTGSGPAVLVSAVRDGWIRTLGTTWPVGPRPELMLFVPLLVVLTGAVAVEVLRRTSAPLAALLPGLGLLVLAQAYAPTTAGLAVAVAFGYAASSLALLAWTATARAGAVRLGVAAAVIALLAAPPAFGATAWSATGRPSAVLAEKPATMPVRAANPLDEIAGRLQHRDRVAFRIRSDAPTDRWTLAVLDGFDGVSWTSSGSYQRLGQALPDPVAAAAPVRRRSASVTVVDVPGPWLPSRSRTTSVSGVDVLVDPATGTLLADATPAGSSYELTWAAPDLSAVTLTSATVDPTLGGGMALGTVPASLQRFARAAVGDQAPSMRTALRLEAFLRDGYRVAGTGPLPTGHSYAQLTHFLGTSKRGTSEQFATAYVILARLVGIPARLVVGYRQPATRGPDGTTVVRDGDILAWPEVAVSGLGWVALDPTSSVAGAGERAAALADTLDADRAVTKEPGIDAPPPAPVDDATIRTEEPPQGQGLLWPIVGAVLLLLLLVAAIPAGKALRGRLRGRGDPARAVQGAWLETRDRLRDHGVRPGRAMTVRDLAGHAGADVAPDLHRLAVCLDRARWSGAPVTAQTAVQAWDAARAVRGHLQRRPVRRRVGAALRPTTLVSPSVRAGRKPRIPGPRRP